MVAAFSLALGASAQAAVFHDKTPANPRTNAFHRPGCRTVRCDRRVDVAWGRKMAARRARQRARELSSGWAIPSEIVRCESNYTNEPPNSSGAAGYYQLTEWSAKGGPGGGYANEHSKAEQDSVARHLYREQGTAPWSSSEACWGGRI